MALISVFTVFSLTVLPLPALAVNVLPAGCSDPSSPIYNTSVCNDARTQQQKGENPIFGSGSLLEIVIQVLAAVIGFMAVLMIIVSGMKMAIAGGDAQALKSARATLLHALLALAVAALAETIVGFILGKI